MTLGLELGLGLGVFGTISTSIGVNSGVKWRLFQSQNINYGTQNNIYLN